MAKDLFQALTALALVDGATNHQIVTLEVRIKERAITGSRTGGAADGP